MLTDIRRVMERKSFYQKKGFWISILLHVRWKQIFLSCAKLFSFEKKNRTKGIVSWHILEEICL